MPVKAHQGQRRIPLRTAGMQETSSAVPVLKLQTTDTRDAPSSHRNTKTNGHSRKDSKTSPPTTASSAAHDKNSEDDSSHATNYHHIPQVAAAQFARTTTVEPMSDKSPISKRRSQSFRDKHHEREHFRLHHPNALPSTAEAVGETSAHNRSLPQGPNTLQEYFRSRILDDDTVEARRRSTGCMLGKMAAAGRESFEIEQGLLLLPTEDHHNNNNHPAIDECDIVVNPDEHRVDWTQSDEIVPQPKLFTSHPLLRKAESKWALRTKLGNLTKTSKVDNNKLPSPTEEKESDAESPKSPTKPSFFSRFRR